MNIQAYNKAIVALLVPAVLMGLGYFGITPDMPVGEAVGNVLMVLITAVAVYLIPNKK